MGFLTRLLHEIGDGYWRAINLALLSAAASAHSGGYGAIKVRRTSWWQVLVWVNLLLAISGFWY